MLWCNSFFPKWGPNWNYHGYQTDRIRFSSYDLSIIRPHKDSWTTACQAVSLITADTPPLFFWPDMSAGIVHLTCLWKRSIIPCQWRNSPKYRMWKMEWIFTFGKNKRQDKTDYFYHLLSAKIISERLCLFLYRCQMSAWCNSALEDETAWYDCGLIGCWRVL